MSVRVWGACAPDADILGHGALAIDPWIEVDLFTPISIPDLGTKKSPEEAIVDFISALRN